MGNSVRVAVLGASGYTGGEIVRLLEAHPHAEVAYLGGRESAGRTLSEVHPHLAGSSAGAGTLEPLDPDAIATSAEVVFSALPHGVSAGLAPALLDAGRRVIDLAGDFRLDADAYPEWYGFTHPAPERLGGAVYGLPELFGEELSGADLVANPGCYPTTVIMGCAPLVAAGLMEPGTIHVDGKTGLSGAGRGATQTTTYASTQESVRPYRAPHHQHTPEMERGIALATGTSVRVLFVPHLVPTVRGVLTTSYGVLTPDATTDAMTSALRDAYAGAPFVRVLPPGAMVDSKRVRGTNVVELQAIADPRSGTAVVVAAVDNLIKGAAGQAIQNFNLVMGFPESTALPTLAVYP